ncbi:MAG: hypothetical protein QM790_08910 [Nibricoccus sp.]
MSDDPATPAAPSMARQIAVALSIVGGLWAAYILIVSALVGNLLFVRLFGLGFLVWIAWIVRAFAGKISLLLRRGLWVVSFGYNFYWVLLNVRSPAPMPLYTAWWVMAALASIIAIFAERNAGDENEPPASAAHQ